MVFSITVFKILLYSITTIIIYYHVLCEMYKMKQLILI